MTASSVPFVFSPNTLIQSAQVNADFNSVVGSLNNIDAGQITTGILPVSNGGTGVSTAAAVATSLNLLPLTGGTLTGPLTGTSITASGNIQGYDITATHNLTAVNEFTVNIVSGNYLNATGDIHADGNIAANGNMQCYDLFAIHNVNGVNVNASNSVTGNLIYSTGAIQAVTSITAGTNMQCYDMFAIHNLNSVNVNASGTVTAFNYVTTSDDIIKTDIADYGRGLDAVLMLNPVSFEYLPGVSGLPDGQRQYGLVAQHVESVIPEMVGETEIDIEGIPTRVSTLSATHLTFVLINAVKELTARVQALEAASGAP